MAKAGRYPVHRIVHSLDVEAEDPGAVSVLPQDQHRVGAGGIQGAEHRCQVGAGGGAEKGAVGPKDLQPGTDQRSGASGQADICLVTAGAGKSKILHGPAGQGARIVLAKAGRYPVHRVVHSLEIEAVITHTCTTDALDDDSVTPVNIKEAVD